MIDVFPARGCSLRLDDQDATNGTLTLVIAGDVAEQSALRLHSTVIDALRRYRPACVEIDMADAAFLDPPGVRALLLCQADAEQVGCRLVLTGLRPAIREMLRSAGLLERFGPVPAPVPPPAYLTGKPE
jgi:anti-anti-sigma factor